VDCAKVTDCWPPSKIFINVISRLQTAWRLASAITMAMSITLYFSQESTPAATFRVRDDETINQITDRSS